MRDLPQPYQRPDGRWTAQVSVGYIAGKRARKTVYGRTSKECRNNLIEALHDSKNDTLINVDERTTLAAFLTRWLDAIGPSLRPRTRRTYADHVRLHIAPALGSVRLVKLDAEQVQRFLNARSAAGMSPKTVRHLRATLRAALNQAMEWGHVRHNAAAGRAIRLPRLEESRINALTPEEVRHLLTVSAERVIREGYRLHALWVVTVFLGLRQGEVLGLRWANLDARAGTLRIDRALQRIDGTLQLVPTKNRGSERTLTLPHSVTAALAAHRAAQDVERRRPGYVEHGLIFATTIGTPIDPRNVIRDWHALTRAAHLPRIRFHDLRHTAATLMLAAGVDVKLVAETLGHRDATMVLRVYAHVMPHQRDEAATRMEAMLG